MKIIMHIGTHKTGTTTFQGIISKNHFRLVENGIWYELEYPVHHHAAWEVMMGGCSTLDKMVRNARANGCNTVIVSSEQFEPALKFYDMLDVFRIFYQKNDIKEIQWHVSIREPGEYFSSLYYELQGHFFCNIHQMYYDICRKGYFHVEKPFLEKLDPYCCFVFDYFSHLSEFQSQLQVRGLGEMFVHDYNDADPFPGWRILEKNDILNVIKCDETFLNVRSSKEEVLKKSIKNIDDILYKSDNYDVVREKFREIIQDGLEDTSIYSKNISLLFGESYRKALKIGSDLKRPVKSGGVNHDWGFVGRRSRLQKLIIALKFVYNSYK